MSSNNPFTNSNRLTIPAGGPGDRDSVYSQQSVESRTSYYGDRPISDNGEATRTELLLQNLREVCYLSLYHLRASS
jgi:hypothetical protein